MKYKLIGTDFDGTLLTTDKKISAQTKKSLYKYKNMGYIVVGVTARSLESAKYSVDIDMFNYLILLNGAYIYDVKNDIVNCISEIDRNTLHLITEYFDDLVSQIDYCSFNTYYTYKNRINRNLSFIKSIDNLDQVNEPISKINMFLKNENELLFYKAILNENYDNIRCSLMGDSDNYKKWLVVLPSKVNKFITLKELGDSLKIDTSEMIFFGDSYNDIEAIKGVGHGVCMVNAIEDVKKYTDNVTYNDNNNDGVVDYLGKFLNDDI